jgi:acetyl-CoA carboxylase biotin carboxyl carrier protein
MHDKKKHELVDESLIRGLAELLNDTGLSEIEIEQKGLRIRIARNMTFAAAMPAPLPTGIVPGAAPGRDADTHPGTLKSPMVGTASRAPETGSHFMVVVGSFVTKCHTELNIEALMTMIHFPAPRTGTVAAVLVENGQPVEFGEPLLIIE